MSDLEDKRTKYLIGDKVRLKTRAKIIAKDAVGTIYKVFPDADPTYYNVWFPAKIAGDKIFAGADEKDLEFYD